MKKFAKSLVVATALAVTLSTAAANTAEAAASVTVTNKQVKKKKVTLTAGKSLQLAVKVNGKKVKTKKLSKKVTFKTSKKKVATVSKSGKIKALKKGSAKITITSKANKKAKYVLKVTVKAKAKAKAAATTAAPTTAAPTTEAPKTEAPTTAAPSTQAPATEAPKTEAPTTEAPKTDEPTSEQPKTEEQTAKDTVVTPKETATIAAKVTFKQVEGIQADVNALAKIARPDEGATFNVKLDGKDYVASFDGTDVLINGQKIEDKAKTSVEVEANVKADKIASLVAFTPASVQSVEFGGVTFTNITDKSFTIGTKDYDYVVEGSSIVVKADAVEDLSALTSVATVEAREAK